MNKVKQRRLNQIIRDLNPDEFESWYHNPDIPTYEVVCRLNIESQYLTKVARHLGLKTRRELGIKANVNNGYKNIFGSNGCNPHCKKWQHCNDVQPVIMPCEVFCYLDEKIDDYEDDSTVFYSSPMLT